MAAEPLYSTPVIGPHSSGRVAGLSAAFGRPFIPWQYRMAEIITEVDPATALRRHSVVVVTVQRQAGKTAELKALVLDRCLFGGPSQRVWYTAQSGKYARDVWGELVTEICAEGSPLAGYVAAKWSQGSEVATFPNGSTFSPFPPTRDALHGKQGDLIIVDEAWRHDAATGAALMQAISPIQATRPGAQLLIVSAAGTAASVWLREWVEAGRAGDVAYLECGIGDGDPTDLDLVIGQHPAVGYTITPAFIRQQAGLLTAGEFARAYGNAWTRVLERTIPADVWDTAATQQPIPDDLVPAFAAEVAQDGSRSAIVAGGAGIVEVVESRDGLDWLAPRIVELVRRHGPAAPVAIPRTGPSASVADEVAAAGVDVTSLTTAEDAAACQRFMTGLLTGGVRYRPHPALSLAAGDAVRRNVGDGWVWGRRTSAGPIPELIAATQAHWLDGHRSRPAVAPLIYSGGQ